PAAKPPPPASKPAPQAAKSAPAKPAAKNASSKSSTPRGPRIPESAARRAIASGPTYDETALGADTPELRALAAAERELFPPSQRDLSSPWPEELPFPVAATDDKPRVHASGLPPAPPPSAPPVTSESGKDLAWLATLNLPDLPVRWDGRVVRYLEFFKDDPRGRATFTLWHRRSGRYIAQVRRTLRNKSLPEDLAALAMIESGFTPTARSPVGALGMWQFMAETGKIYGLMQDRWADQRMNVTIATEAAADHLSDLHRRFGSWDLAMAAYNMGYGGVLQAVRRYNTNDYWALSKLEGSLPWETTLYVPKILAAAVVSRNLAAFGFQDVQQDAALEGEEVMVAPGTALATVAQACGTTTKEVEALNTELRASRTPPSTEDWRVLVPAGKAAGCSASLAKARKEAPTEHYTVRFGETLEQVAQARRTTAAKLVDLNAIQPGEVIRGGTVLIVPKMDPNAPAVADAKTDPKKSASNDKPAVIVPQDLFVYPDRKRVFYRVQVADTLKDVATAFKVGTDELRRWNDIDPSARLVEGMTLQVFAPPSCDLSQMVVLGESDVHTIVAGTEEFFRHWEEKGRRRTVVTAKAGETIEQIGRRFGVSPALMERINRRGRRETLSEGERVVVWSPGPSAPLAADAPQLAALAKPPVVPERTPPLDSAPAPSLLPALP
ncbi:MAG: transglycosylase SLT domain-containing protein, partial [Labilithrix sp.]|nr:transglycosylase SLT domain-containing protein [Labilithrix sp.]